MRHFILILAAALLLAVNVPAQAEDAVTVAISPETVNIGTTYNGATLTVTGQAPADCDVVVRFMGAPEELHMKEKGKVFNLLWMNKATVVFDGAPKAYIVASDRPVSQIEASSSTGLALADLIDRIEVSGTDDDKTALVGDLEALKGDEGLYAEHPDAVTYGEAHEGVRSYTATLALPAKLAPGSYSVQAMALRGGEQIVAADVETTAQLTGAPAMLATLAFDHGALYGIMATIIAILAGLGVGLVFQSSEAH